MVPNESAELPGSHNDLGAPLLAIYNTAKRWLTTTINYDVVLYDHAILIVRGLSWRDMRQEMQRRKKEATRAGDSGGLAARTAGANAYRSAIIATTPVTAILAADPGNRLVPYEEIESAALRRRLGSCTLKLRLTDGTRLKFIWLNSRSLNADYDDVTRTLTDLLTDRFRAS